MKHILVNKTEKEYWIIKDGEPVKIDAKEALFMLGYINIFTCKDDAIKFCYE